MEIDLAPVAAERYYKLDNTRLSFTDCWCLTRGANFLVLAGARLLRIPMDFSHFTPEPRHFSEMIVPEADLASVVREAIQPIREQLEAAGFRWPVYYSLKNPLVPWSKCGALAMLAPDNMSIAKIVCVQNTAGQVELKTLVAGFVSALERGGLLVSSGRGSKGFAPPPGLLTRHSLTKNPLKLWTEHQQHVEKLKRDPALLIHSFEEFVRVADDSENRGTRHRIESGVLRPLSDDEVANIKKAITKDAPPVECEEGDGTAGTRLSEAAARVQVEIAKQQNPKESWKKNAWLLVISAVAAVFTFKGDTGWQIAGQLMLVLFVHELGHFAAMKCFGYRNVRMFFLPFFGAAVSGRKFGQSAARKAVVSLMGPVPGIIIGAALLTFMPFPRNPLLVRTALIFIFLNLFNLLPLLPLDGGWFWHAVLFSRNRWAEIAFRGVTALLLVALSITVVHSPGLGVFAIFLMLALRTTVHSARIAQELRAENFLGENPSTNEIPPRFTEEAVTRLKAAMPKGKLNVQNLAHAVIDMYDRVTSRRAGIFESVGLVLVYAGAIYVGVQAILVPLLLRLQASGH